MLTAVGPPSAWAAAATATALATDANPSAWGQDVTLTAHVTGGSATPTGTVTFSDGGTALGTRPLDSDGAARFVAIGLDVGTHSMSAAYAGDSSHDPSNDAISQRVDKAATRIVETVLSRPGAARVAFQLQVLAVPPGAGGPS